MGPTHRRTTPRVLFVGAKLDGVGGIPSYSRAVIEALREHADVETLNLVLSGSAADQARAFGQAAAVLARRRPDLLVLGHVGLGPIGLAWRAAGGRYAVMAYGIEIWGPRTALLRRTLRHAHRVWPISTFTRDEVLRAEPRAVTGPGLGGSIDESFFQDRDGVEGAVAPLRVAFVASLENVEYKGADTLVEAVGRVAATHPIFLRIVGSGRGSDDLARFVAEHDAAGVIELVGRVDHEQLLAEYRRCDALVLLSRFRRGEVPRGEGLGLVVLEAAAAGAAVIGTRAGGAGDTVVEGETGHLLEPGDVDALADVLRRWAQDPAQAHAMGRAGREFVRTHHSRAAFTARVGEALDATLARPSRARPAAQGSSHDGSDDRGPVHINAVGAVMGGAARHLSPFLLAVADQRPAWDLRLVASEGAEIGPLPDTVTVTRVPRFSVAQRLVWESTTLPRTLRSTGARALLNLTNSGPFLAPCPSLIYQRNPIFFDRAWVEALPARQQRAALARRQLAYAQLRFSAGAIVPSEAMADMLRDWRGFPRRCPVHVVHHAVDTTRFAFAPKAWPPAVGPDRPLRLTAVGLPSAHKDHETALRIVRRLNDEGLPTALELTVDANDPDPLIQALVRLAHDLGLEDRVRFSGSVPTVEVVYRRNDIMLFSSITESFGFPIVEAMASGIPVVASAIATNRELLGPAGRLFPVRDVGAGADAVRALLAEEPEALGRALVAAADRAATFSWERNAAAVIDLIERAG
jgi:phosphatidylinositol alpha-1,6-mannosyltransferase